MIIKLGTPRVDGSTVSVSIDPGKAGKYFVADEFWVEYVGVDLTNIASSLLVLPALGTILPAAYALGCEVEAEEVDREFATAADELAPLWGSKYPRFHADRFALNTRLRANESEQVEKNAMMLYSGGLDSIATLLANRDEVGVLLSVWGGRRSTGRCGPLAGTQRNHRRQ